MCLVWDNPGKPGFIISYFNDYLARYIQHNFTSLSLQPGDMAVKPGLILRQEGKKGVRQSTEKIGVCACVWCGGAGGEGVEEKYLIGILQKHLLS